MKEVTLQFTDTEYAHLLEMREDGQTVEEYLIECLCDVLPWLEGDKDP